MKMREPLSAENLLQDTDGLPCPARLEGGTKQPISDLAMR